MCLKWSLCVWFLKKKKKINSSVRYRNTFLQEIIITFKGTDGICVLLMLEFGFAFFFTFLPQLVLPYFDPFPLLYLFFLPTDRCSNKDYPCPGLVRDTGTSFSYLTVVAFHKDKDLHLTKERNGEERNITKLPACCLFSFWSHQISQ